MVVIALAALAVVSISIAVAAIVWPPAWVFGVLGLLLPIVVVSVTVVRGIAAHPRLELQFVTIRHGLKCYLVNPPIRNRVSKGLRIRRSQWHDVSASLQIDRVGGKRVFSVAPHIARQEGQPTQTIALTASDTPSWFGIAIATNRQVWPGWDTTANDALAPGLYRAEVEVTTDGNKRTLAQFFVVQTEHPWMLWIPNSSKTLEGGSEP